ncbi:uncharacterized protein B0H18DRAFT_379396, partial [Fomitopsis serialis]|uniref:uncharacterized protein n=1 Tax=Fomitopsis serialis TaxID=139415 RepID=UPI0020084F70
MADALESDSCSGTVAIASRSAPQKFQAPYDRVDGDVILRSCDDVSYRVHRIILTMASPVFADMFSLPQSSDIVTPSETDQHTVSPPIVDLTEDGKTIRAILDACYPFKDPDLNDLDAVRTALEAAAKYEVAKAIQFGERRLQAFVEKEPLRVFAIACKMDFEDMAKAAAHQVHARSIFKAGLVYVKELDEVSAGCYHRLLQHYRRRGNWKGLKFCMTSKLSGKAVKKRAKGQAKQTPLPPASDAPPPFHSPHADAVIITSDNVHFHLQRQFISTVAPGLADRFPVATALKAVQCVDVAGDSDAYLSRNRERAEQHSSLAVEEDSTVVGALLQLCSPLDVPDLPGEDIDFLTRLVDAARKYRIERVIWLLKILWPRYLPHEPFRAYVLASCYGWTMQAKDAARVLLGETFEAIETSYSPALEIISTQPYFRLLAYHANCSAAISDAGTAMTTWLSDDEVIKNISSSCRSCSTYYTNDKTARWIVPAISKAVELLLQRPSPRMLTEGIRLAEIISSIQEKKCSSCSPSPLIYISFCDSVASKAQQLIDNV